jgi:hypothetical protein
VASKLITFAKAVDDFIIDRLLQPGINRADWHLGIPATTVARVCTVLGAGIGIIWLHRFDYFPSMEFYQDALCLGIMVIAAHLQINAHQSRAPKRPALMPAIRATGLFWRSAWLVDIALFPSQWPVEAHGELTINFMWTFLVILPYWIICCRPPPPPEERRVGVFVPVTISAR